MNKIYHLGNCTTCQRIIRELDLPHRDFTFQDIKKEPITEKQLDEMKTLAGSYEQLFSRVAMKYRSLKLGDKNLTEPDYQRYILEEYTFLKRPVIIIGNEIFIGNSKKNIAAVADKLGA